MTLQAVLGPAPAEGSAQAIVRTPYLWVHDDTAALTIPNVLSASCSVGYDLRIAEAEVHVPSVPAGLNYYDQITITMGATEATAAVRFVGYLVEYDRTLWPREVTLVLRGRLILADRMENPSIGGTDLTAGGAGATDQAMITAALHTYVGLDSAQLAISGTGAVLGTVATGEFIWAHRESALGFIQRLDEICLGFRTFDTPSGVVARQLISTTSPGDALFTFTEGVDIVSGTNQQSILPTRNKVIVEGCIPPGDTVPITFSAQIANASIPTPPSYIVYDLTSRLIEKELASDGGDGLSAEEVATWYVGEYGHQQVRTTFATPRDDVIPPGTIIAVVAPSRLAVNTKFFVQKTQCAIDEAGAFTQTLTCLSGPE